jgi:transposase, IS30 family
LCGDARTIFRDIVKTGTSFDDFTQETVNLIFSHVNAVIRKQFNGKSAYDMFSFYYSEALASAMGISFIPAAEVIQSPKLLRKIFS